VKPRSELNFKLLNLRGGLFATAFCFSTQSVLRLGSSLILTRLLRPEAYGIVTLVMSVVFVVEMLSDIGVTIFIIRDKNGEEPRYLNTAWTIRFSRHAANSTVLFLLAPFIATSLYHAPELIAPLRVFSPWFLLLGLESMSFPLAIRRKQAGIVMYSELAATAVSICFSVLYTLHFRDYWGIIYGTLLNRLLVTLLSHAFLRDVRPRPTLDWVAAREMFRFTRFTMPSSWLTLALTQFDKVVFLRLFDLNLLGVYGVAGNIAGPVEGLISKISQMVLYPRLAQGFRDDRDSLPLSYYTGNLSLFAIILMIPAAIGGAAQLIITVLYDPRYSAAGLILQAFMMRALLLALASPAEDLLIAAGEYQVILHGNILRAIWVVAGSIIGYYLFGFIGFIYGLALSGAPPLLYYLWLQRTKGLMIARYEFFKVAFALGVGICAYLASSLLLLLWQTLRIKI
jgi:O-antigen/teichoic acid export membrane protein